MRREAHWRIVYNLTRDHGQEGMVLQALSGVDIALWDIAGKALGAPLHLLPSGRCDDTVPVGAYGMILRKIPACRGLSPMGRRACRPRAGVR